MKTLMWLARTPRATRHEGHAQRNSSPTNRGFSTPGQIHTTNALWFKQQFGGHAEFPIVKMDIDDILADLDHSSTPQESTDLQALTRVWVAERVSPELLTWPEELVERVLGRISKQIEVVEEQTGSMDPKTNFKLIIVQTELERFKFLMRSLLRARIAKIDAHPLYYSTSSDQSLLSDSESQYLRTHQALLSAHYNSSFLSQFPAQLQRLDDRAGGISMVDSPDLDRAVFCRILRDIGVVRVEGTDVSCDMARGDVWVIRWSAIKDAVGRGDVELI